MSAVRSLITVQTRQNSGFQVTLAKGHQIRICKGWNEFRARPERADRRVGHPDTPRCSALTLTVARETDRPLQVHAGFGDPDIDLGQANPLLLRPLLEDPRRSGVRIVILHMAYPYFREADFMAVVRPDIHLDLSLALPFLGAGAVAPLIEILALAPASKLLYGSDVQALPELFALAADWARGALGGALTWLAERGELTLDESREVALAENAVRLYGLPVNAIPATLTGAGRSPRAPRRGVARSPSTRRPGV